MAVLCHCCCLCNIQQLWITSSTSYTRPTAAQELASYRERQWVHARGSGVIPQPSGSRLRQLQPLRAISRSAASGPPLPAA
jgi:hypothetical protein